MVSLVNIYETETLFVFFRPPSCIVPKVHCAVVVAQALAHACSFAAIPWLKDSKSTFKMASSAKKKKIETVSLRTFKNWSFCEDFTVETDDDDQISLLKCKI